MTGSVIWTASDPFLAARLRRTASIRRGENAVTAAVVGAMGRWLTAATHAIYGRPAALEAPAVSLAADAGDATESTGAAGASLPNLNLWPDDGSWQLMIDQVVIPEIQKVFGKAFAEATREADIHAAHYEQAYVATVSDRLSRNLWPDRVFEEVRGVIADGIAEGLSITHITEEISQVMSVPHQEWQARRIARTETIGASNAGAWNGASAIAEITGDRMFKQWFATMDTRVRLDHSRAHHQVVPLETDFIVGGYLMAYPAAPDGPAEEVCNCRCALLVLSETEAAQWINPDDWSDETPGPDENVQDILTEAGVSQANTTISGDDEEPSVTGSNAGSFVPLYQGVDRVLTFAGPRPVIDPTSTPPTVKPPTDQNIGQTSGGGDVGTWWGVLAPLDTPSADGRMISTPNTEDGAPRTRPLPLPLLYQDTLASGHDGAFQVGLICGVLAAGGNLYAYGTFDMDDPRAAGIARKTASGNAGWVSVDLDDTTMEIDDDSAERPMAVASDWRLMSATLVSQPAFPEAKICTGRPGDAMPDLDSMIDNDDVGVRAAVAGRRTYSVRPVFRCCQGAGCDLCDPDLYQMCEDRECLSCRAFMFHVYGLCVDAACPTCTSGGTHAPGEFAGATCDDPDCEYCGLPYAPADDETDAERAEAERLGRHGLSPGGCGPDCPECAAAAEDDEADDDGDGFALCNDPECTEYVEGAADQYRSVAGRPHPHRGHPGMRKAPRPVKSGRHRKGQSTAHPHKGHRMPGKGHAPHKGAKGPAHPGKRAGHKGTAKTPPAAPLSLSITTERNDAVAATLGFSVFSVLHPDTGLPVADVAHAWDSDAAAKRVADYAKGAGDAIDPAKYGKAFLWREDGADPHNVTAYKLGFADVIDGRLTIVPRAVYAIGNVLSGGRGGVSVPDAAMPALKSAAKRLYGRVAKASGNDDLKAPWEADDKSAKRASVISNRGAVFLSSLVASGEFAPPRAWFENPQLEGPTGTTVTDDGRVYGHIATWRTCHTGFKDKCVTAPRSKSNYAYFHLGTVRTAEGEDIAVGTLHYGTDHADTRAPLASAQRHYADTGCAAAVVCVGEDEFGIWYAGAALPDADLVTLRHAPLSGDWRSIGGSMELVGALCVNQPGFPIPRPRFATDDRERVYALTAAGAIAPPACEGCDACSCESGCGDQDHGSDAVMTRFITTLSAGIAAELRAGDARNARDERFAAAARAFGRVPKPRTAAVLTGPARRAGHTRPASATARPNPRLERMGVLVASMKKGA